MRIAVYLPLLFPLLAALIARPVGERLPPRLATWLLTVGSLVPAELRADQQGQTHHQQGGG
ncbi:hypothetical protein AB0O00_34515, partial [Kitasatospora sp. NPDC093558]